MGMTKNGKYSRFVYELMLTAAQASVEQESIRKRLFESYEKKYSNIIIDTLKYKSRCGIRDAYINFDILDFESTGLFNIRSPSIMLNEWLKEMANPNSEICIANEPGLLCGFKVIEQMSNRAFTVYFKW